MIAYEIENGMDCFESSITVKTLAEAVGVDPTTMGRIIKGKIRETSFWNLYRISTFLYKGDNVKFISWLHKLDRPENIKAAMEYLALNKKTEVLKEIIANKATNTADKNLNKWGNFYRLIIKHEEEGTALKDVLRNVSKIDCGSDTELGMIIRLIKANTHFRIVCSNSSHLEMMSEICDEVLEEMSEIETSFLKISINLRLNDLVAKRELYVRSNTHKARNYAKNNISQEICPLFKANALYTVGTSFTFENYEESVSYIEKAIIAYRDADYGNFADDLERSAISLVSAYHGQIVAERDSVEVAHYEAKWGDKKLALELIDEAIEREGESMFKTCYKGIAANNEELLFKSLSQFLKIGDLFFAQLPLQYLKKSSNPQTIALADIMYNQFIN